MTLNDGGIRLAYVLDDEQRVGAIVCTLLTGIGIEAHQFVSPAQFLTRLEQLSPDLVVLDLALGQTDAIEIILALEVHRFTGKVLLISGRDNTILSEVEKIGRTHGLSMLPSLRKPFRLVDIQSSLLASAAPEDRKAKPDNGRLDDGRAQPLVNLDEALRKNWLEVWYQPKIDLKSIAICGAEALIRARHPDHGVVGPAELLPPTGDPLYRPLSFFVLRRAMADWTRFAERGLPLKLSINVPASILSANGFVSLVRQLTPRDPNFPGLIIEVTEDEVIRDPERVYEIATQLKLYKTWISIDDFGSASAALSRLKDLPFVELKLDRSFVSNCGSDPVKRALCQTVVDLAHRFGASLCAEGVETEDDLRCVRTLGFDTVQGYIFAKPMPPDRFIEFLVARGSGRSAETATATQTPLPAPA
jgi:EAL domain-containing protein (putative c-di-GMP-specific phosphodiesterase class I)/FixJ family two-component response regulator